MWGDLSYDFPGQAEPIECVGTSIWSDPCGSGEDAREDISLGDRKLFSAFARENLEEHHADRVRLWTSYNQVFLFDTTDVSGRVQAGVDVVNPHGPAGPADDFEVRVYQETGDGPPLLLDYERFFRPAEEGP